MMDFLYFLMDLADDGILGWMMLTLFAITFAILLGLILYFVDRVGVTTKPCDVTVIGRFHTPTQIINVMNNINGTMVSTPTTIPESWSLRVMDERKNVMNCYVSESAYNNVASGTVLIGMVGYGRLSSHKFCNGLITGM